MLDYITIPHALYSSLVHLPPLSKTFMDVFARARAPQGYDILEDMYSPKTSIANFAHDLCAKKRVHLDKFMAAMVALMQQYVTAAAATNNAGVRVVRLHLSV